MNIILFREGELDSEFSIHDDRIWHVRKILNCEVDDKFDIGIINGSKGEAWIQNIEGDKVTLDYELSDEEPDQLYPITLIVGHPRPQSIKKILRETTALGVEKIRIAGTDKGEKSYFQSSLWKDNKIQKYLIEGASQAYSTTLPKVEKYNNIKKSISDISDQYTRICLDNISPKSNLSEANINTNKVALLVGSERGWSERERSLIKDNRFSLFSLGDRVLRTETACVSGVTILLEKLGAI